MKVWLILGLLAILLVPGCSSQKQQDLNTTIAETNHVEQQQQVEQQVVAIQANGSLVNEYFEFNSSKVIAVTLPVARYFTEFMTDKEARFMILNEQSYKNWMTGYYGQSKVTTNRGSTCCAAEGKYTFDVNEGEDGTYYLVVEDPQGNHPTKGRITITKIAGFV